MISIECSFSGLRLHSLSQQKTEKNIKNNTGMSMEVIASRSLVSWVYHLFPGQNQATYRYHIPFTKYHGHPQYKQTLDSTNNKLKKGVEILGSPLLWAYHQFHLPKKIPAEPERAALLCFILKVEDDQTIKTTRPPFLQGGPLSRS